LFTADAHAEVEATWGIYRKMSAAYRHEDRSQGHELMGTLIEAVSTGYSNARSEGYNRLAKHQARNAFGYRNVDNHRRAIRWDGTRQHRRASATNSEVPGQVR